MFTPCLLNRTSFLSFLLRMHSIKPIFQAYHTTEGIKVSLLNLTYNSTTCVTTFHHRKLSKPSRCPTLVASIAANHKP